MKVIDLLNKIANREEVPEKIRIYNRNDSVYIWKPIENTSLYHYFNIATGERLGSDWRLDGKLLTEEIEIIEKEKEIEYPLLHRIGGNETTGDKMPNQEYLINCNFEHLNKAVYQLIDEVNKLKKEGK